MNADRRRRDAARLLAGTRVTGRAGRAEAREDIFHVIQHRGVQVQGRRHVQALLAGGEIAAKEHLVEDRPAGADARGHERAALSVAAGIHEDRVHTGRAEARPGLVDHACAGWIEDSRRARREAAGAHGAAGAAGTSGTPHSGRGRRRRGGRGGRGRRARRARRRTGRGLEGACRSAGATKAAPGPLIERTGRVFRVRRAGHESNEERSEGKGRAGRHQTIVYAHAGRSCQKLAPGLSGGPRGTRLPVACRAARWLFTIRR